MGLAPAPRTGMTARSPSRVTGRVRARLHRLVAEVAAVPNVARPHPEARLSLPELPQDLVGALVDAVRKRLQEVDGVRVELVVRRRERELVARDGVLDL